MIMEHNRIIAKHYNIISRNLEKYMSVSAMEWQRIDEIRTTELPNGQFMFAYSGVDRMIDLNMVSKLF